MDTKLQPDKGLLPLYLFGFVLLILVVVTIPTYFFFQNEFEKNHSFKMAQLMGHSNAIVDKIHQKGFELPTSFINFAALYDHDNRLMSTTSTKHFPNDLTQVRSQANGYYYYKTRLYDNPLDARVLVVATPTQKEHIYIKLTLVILGLFIFFLLSTWFLLRATITPYEKLNRYLDAFFNDAMHELKTPIGVIQFNLDLLEQKDPGKKEVKRAYNGVKGLQFIYEDIEYLIKHKNIEFKTHHIDMSSTLFQRIEFFESFAQAKKIEIRYRIKQHLYVDMNKIELQRVIDNTLSNALKYSKPHSKILIMLHKDSIKNKVIFCVKDWGKGIKNTKVIFNRYHREDSVVGGFGIGLNIVKTICDKNNIKIIVKSKPGSGSSFCYRLQAT